MQFDISDLKNFKIHLYGNVLNNGYYLGRILTNLGYNVTLFLDKHSPFDQDYPWWENAALNQGNLPSWIKFYNFKPNYIFPSPKEREMIKDFSEADIALVCGYGPIVAGKAKVPFVFYSYGEDLNIADTFRGLKRVFNQAFRFKRPSGIIKYLTIGIAQRFYLKRAEFIGIAMGYQLPYLKALGLMEKYRMIRLVYDFKNFHFNATEQLLNKYSAFDRVYFMISRHVWSSLWRESVKGNDKFIRAFATYVKCHSPNVRLVLIDKGADVPKSKQLITQLGIEEHVEWVPEMNKDGIKSYLALKNLIVVDQFAHDEWYQLFPEDKRVPAVKKYIKEGKSEFLKYLENDKVSIITFGSGSTEAMIAKRPLITTFTDADFYDNEEPPHFNAFTEYEILNVLEKIHKMSDSELDEVGQKEYDFIYKFHSYDISVNLYLDLLKKAISKN